jgi:pimeloyl-ACP methyl ester carboxylesterase
MADQTAAEIATYFRVCGGARVHDADTKADSGTVILMLAPWPETIWAFRRIWSQVTTVGRVVAVDMPGFGHSDQPEGLIAPDAMGGFLARLIEEWDLGAPHVVGPDVGTAAALFLAAQSPEKVTSLTIGGGAVAFPLEVGGALQAVIEAPSLDDVGELDARANIGAAVERRSSSPRTRGARGLRERLDLGRFAESARFVRHYRVQNKVLGELLSSIETPAMILAGDRDDLVPWSNNQLLADTLPNSVAHRLDAGHFAWEEVSGKYGGLVAEWVAGGYKTHAPR